MGFPYSLYKPLYKKLKHSNYDSGEFLQILRNEDEYAFQLMARVPIAAQSQVFLIDHAFISLHKFLYDALSTNEALLKRMLGILKFSDYKPPIPSAKPTRPSLLDLIIELKVSPFCDKP